MTSVSAVTEARCGIAKNLTISAPLPICNLLNNLEELKQLLLAAVQEESWLNAFLLAAGMNQIVEDYLHPDPLMVGKSKKYLSHLARPIRLPAVWSAEVAEVVLPRLLNQIPARRDIVQWQIEFAALLDDLAAVAIDEKRIRKLDEMLYARLEVTLAQLDRFPKRLLQGILRLPSCFRSFDQQPADLACLVERFVERWPDRTRPVLVLGVRTSGSYLAPLCAAFLRVAGFENVKTLTIRPARQLLIHERELLNSIAKKEGLLLITDDPPTTGGSLAATAKELEARGISINSIVLLLQLFGASTTLPPILNKYQSVLLEWEAWRVNDQLAPQAVQAVLTEMFAPDVSVKAVKRVSLPERSWQRSHVSARYHVEIVQGNVPSEREVFVKGVGAGYFGEHTAILAERLSTFTPEVYGVRDGLQYRAWLPETQRLAKDADAISTSALAEAATQYVFERHLVLPAKEDVSFKLLGRISAWEVASERLSHAFRQGWWLIRIPAIDPRVKRLLVVNQPSVVDGGMALSKWFTTGSADHPDSKAIVKIDIDERDFCNLDLYCYDPVYDLAGLAASTLSSDLYDTLPDQLRCAYERLSGRPISAERWLLYQLVYFWDQWRNPPNGSIDPSTPYRAYARALQAYFAETFFQNIQPMRVPGPVCALDIDGVLENETLEAPSLTPSSAMALRALLLHGYQVVLATGRSLDEVRERCRAYRLMGGVAEYGAVTYDHATGRVSSQLDEAKVANLEHLKNALLADNSIHIDPDFRYSVRAYRIDRTGHRRGLANEAIVSALERSGLQGAIRPIRGDGQTDFVSAGIDKGTGLHAFMAQSEIQSLQVEGQPFAFAMGDTISDLPMFELAARAFAPANADASVKDAAAKHKHIRVMKHIHQRGLAEAVALTLGHPPAGCSVCKAPAHSADTRMLLSLLGVPEHSKWRVMAHALLISLNARRQ